MPRKYSLHQYVHDTLRLKLIAEERAALREVRGGGEWLRERLDELLQDELTISKRMYRYETHPNNRPKP